MVAAGAQIIGLKEFRAALKAMGPEWPRELRAVHRKIATEGARRSSAVAAGMGGEQGHFAGAIGSASSQREARVTVRPQANAAFWGAKKHTGWYAAPRYFDSPAQHPKWVGASWEPAEFGQGPYAINDALAQYKPQMFEDYLKMIDDLAHRAFPDA